MPIVEVTLASGRTPDQIRSLISHVTSAVVASIDAPATTVRVLVREIPPAHWAAGDVTLEERHSNKQKDVEGA
jgi:4-oxalocrotonate tautomerase